MEFIRKKKCLVITIDDEDKKFLSEIKDVHGSLESDNAMYDFFEPYLSNQEFGWIQPEDIMALTSAPILGILDENDNVVEAYGYMNYAITSMLEDFEDYGETELQKG